MKKAFILGIMAFFAIGIIQNVNAQNKVTNQNQQSSEVVDRTNATGSESQRATPATHVGPTRNIGQRPSSIETQTNGRAIKPGQDMRGDAKFNARNGRTGNRVSAQTNTQNQEVQNPEAAKPGVKKDSNNSNSGSSYSGNSDSKKKGADKRPRKAQ